MKYKVTSSSDSDVVYLGVHVYRHGDTLRTEVYDREDEYPFHIMRYPHVGTVAAPQQKAGVIMGRLVTCFQVCNTVSDFKASALRVIQRAFQRGYTKRLVQSVWSRFLFQYWRSGDVRRPALKGWFRYAWKVALSDEKVGGNQKLPNHHQLSDPNFMELFGMPPNIRHPPPSPPIVSTLHAAAAEIHNTAPPGISENEDAIRPLIEAILAFDADRGSRVLFGQSVSDTAVVPLFQGDLRSHVADDVELDVMEMGQAAQSSDPLPSVVGAVGKQAAQVTIEIPVTVEKLVEVTVTVDRTVEKTIQVPVTVDRVLERTVEVPVIVERLVEKTVPVTVDRTVEVPVERTVPIPVQVERTVAVPVERTVSVPVDRIVEVQVERTVHVPVPIDRTVEVPVERIIPVTVEVPVTSVMETTVSTVEHCWWRCLWKPQQSLQDINGNFAGLKTRACCLLKEFNQVRNW